MTRWAEKHMCLPEKFLRSRFWRFWRFLAKTLNTLASFYSKTPHWSGSPERTEFGVALDSQKYLPQWKQKANKALCVHAFKIYSANSAFGPVYF